MPLAALTLAMALAPSARAQVAGDPCVVQEAGSCSATGGPCTVDADCPAGETCTGTGTVTLPPEGCPYLSPTQFHVIVDGLPPGTTIEIAAIHRDFICKQPGLPQEFCNTPGGNLGGDIESFQSTLELNMTGTGDLAGFNRVIQLPVFCEVHTGPRIPGDAVQTFPNEMVQLQGSIFGDPDFDQLNIIGGSAFGLPSPGQTTLTQLGPPGSDWQVDSFFDITYRIDYVGAPGGALSGMSGSTTGTVRMQAEGPPAPACPLADSFCQTRVELGDCRAGVAGDLCFPAAVRFNAVAPQPIVDLCDCFGPGGACGAIQITPLGTPPTDFQLQCSGLRCPNGIDLCQIHLDGNPTGQISINQSGVQVGVSVTCGCPQPQQLEACCLPDGACQMILPTDCVALRGKPLGPTANCLGDANGDGIDDACAAGPCQECGPGAHFIDAPPCPPGGSDQDTIDTAALVGIDIDGDCVADTSTIAGGIATIGKIGPLDDSANFPGTRAVDGHTDVIDTEIIAMSLSGGGISLTAGAGLGINPLPASLGNVAEQPGNPAVADSFFNVFFEVSGGGLGGPAYNHAPIQVATVIDCLPPNGRYIHIQGCTPLFDSAVPGLGNQVGNLVSARHVTFPVCCFADNTCGPEPTATCKAAGGTPVAACLGDGNGDGADDACLPPPPPDDHVTIAPTQVEFGNGNAIPAIPADFFEPGSQPFVGAVPMTGGDAGTGGGGGGRVSVRLQRSADPVTPADPVGTSRTVPIEMVALSLTSVSPITVTDPAGVGTQWNLEVRVNRIEMSRLAPGTLTATKTHPNGGTFDAAFPLCADVLFTRVSDGVQRTLNLCSANGTVLDLSVSGSWVHNVDPALGLATPPGAAFNPGIEHEDIGVPQAVKPSTAQTPDIPPSVVHTVVPPPAFCPLPGNPFGLPDPCEQLQARDCQSTSTTDSCLPTLVRVVPGGAVAETCACITPGPGCGPIDIGPGGDTVSCPGQCFPPDVPGPCVVFTDDGTGPQSTGATSISVANLPVDTLLSCGCEQPPQPEACCLPDGTCAQLIPADCAAQRGKSLGAGSQCLGDQDGDGIDDACGSTPCAECGPGAHFIDQPPCPAGGSDQDTIDTGALVGIDLNGDCLADTSVVLGGISTIGKVGPLDDSAQFPGLRPVDNHTDVVDTEIIAMRLSGGGVSMIAGAGLGANALAASLGAVAEQPGNAAAADSFFDVFFEVSGGGLGGPAYNQTPINVATVIDCLPPKGRYIHIQGCTPIFDSPVPGVGTQVGNLVSARHFTFPECCLPDGTCTAMATKLCQAAGGTPVPRCLGDANGNMIDDACEAPPPPDPHRTVQGNSLTFGTPDIPGLPADFFGPGSDPLTGVTVNMQGGPNDTLIQRDGPIFCPGAGFPRPCDPVSVEIVQLDLVSVAPITVTFNGGASTEDWDLAVSLSGLPSSPNLLTATKTHANGGIYDSTIPVLPRLTFTKVSNPADVRVLDYGVELIPELRINFTNVPWVVNLDPGLVGTISAPSNGNFVPSILEQTPGDTATQIVVQATGQSKGGGVTHPVRPRPTVCPLPGGANDPCAPFQVRDCQGSASDLCLPDVIVVTGTCLAAPQLPCTADNQCPANVCVKTSTVAACACATDADCRVEFDPVNNAPFCVGTCPPGEICELFTTPVTLPDGTVTEGFFCDCVTPPACKPTVDQTTCEPHVCPVAAETCEPVCVSFDPLTGVTTVVECDCVGQDECRILGTGAAGAVTAAAAAAGPCVVPEALVCAITGEPCTVDADCPVMAGNTCSGAGTVTLPPIGCDYLSPDEFHEIVDGLPFGTTLELKPIHKNFICDRQPGAAGFPGCPPPGLCEEPGGALGGKVDCFDSTLQLTVTGNATGGLSGFSRTLQVPVMTQVETGPRTPGDAVQDFPTEIVALQGELFGDPDFCTLRITGGRLFGLPSPGRTTLTNVGGGNWNVDSFFDVFYEIDFVGCPGSALEGLAGTTQATIRMQTGAAPSCTGTCPAGEVCDEQRTVDPATGRVDLCCKCIPAVPLCPLPGGANDPCASFQARDCQGAAGDLCLPDVITVSGVCAGVSPPLPCSTDADCAPVGTNCVLTSSVQACACATDTDCRVEFDPVNNAPFCVGTCPPGEICELFTTPVTLPDGTVVDGFRCDCVTPPACKPTADQTTCEPHVCPVVAETCEPVCVSFDPLTGVTTVVECDCVGQDECRVLGSGVAGAVSTAAAAAGPCVVPEARTCAITGESCNIDSDCPVMAGNTCTGPPTGTVMLPPIGCEYLSPEEFHEIVDGLPFGTTLELAPIHKSFICDRQPGAAGFPGCPPPGICEEPGGALGGRVDCFDSTLQLTVTGNATGGLSGFNRTLFVPVSVQVQTGPRTPGDPVQDFDTQITFLQGELFGDPDFCTLRITGGSGFGLPSPGHTTLTRTGGGNWNVDSFFDVFYEIDFVGCPGSALEGFAGTTQATIRMQTGAAPSCKGTCPAGDVCDEQRTVDPVTGRVDLCCKCIPAVTGACCLPDDTCAVTTAADCATRQGQYLGDNTVCLGVEACCLPSGACAQIDAACCTARGGMPQGAGSDCLSVDCPLPACQPNAAGTACEQVVCPANTGCFGECINGSYCDNDVCCLDPAACQCYAKNTKESIKRCGDCFGSCVMGSYCDDPTNPDCCIVPGACACYLPSHDVSIQLCGDCFGECIGGSYCDHPNPSCAVVPGAPACYDATSPISQKFCQDPTTPPDECQASCVNFDPLTGITTVTECNCVGVDSCHVELPTAAGGVTAMAAAAGGPCVVPEARTCAVTGESCTVDANCPVMPGNTCTGAPTGTVMMPPIGCEYLSPDEFHEILAGLPADTQLELAPIHKDFICNRGDGFPGCPPPGVCEETGGTLGGNVDCFDSTLQLTISGNPGGALAGFNRVLSVPVLTRVDTGPRTAGDAVQDFDTEMVQLQGELFGDPDFCTLRITGGTAMGLPSPGHTTLTRLPGGDFQVDSFFDVFYRIEYVGCPGSALEGFSGENGGIIKMQTGSAPSCVGQCPPGERCVEERTVLPDGTFDLCCRCECPQADPPLPEAKVTEKNRFISMVPQNPGRQTALQVTLVSLPGAFSVWNGQQLWVTNPRPITEQAGTPGAQPPPTFTGANGQCTPDCRDWGAVGLIDVFGEWVVPGATYEVRAVDCACNMTDPANFSAPLVLKTSRFGDIVGPFDTQTRQWTQPEGIITILQDAIAALDKFKNRPTAPRKARVELEPNCLDMVVNITEVVRILDAFRGRPYPDVPKNPALRACESVCP